MKTPKAILRPNAVQKSVPVIRLGLIILSGISIWLQLLFSGNFAKIQVPTFQTSSCVLPNPHLKCAESDRVRSSTRWKSETGDAEFKCAVFERFTCFAEVSIYWVCLCILSLDFTDGILRLILLALCESVPSIIHPIFSRLRGTISSMTSFYLRN